MITRHPAPLILLFSLAVFMTGCEREVDETVSPEHDDQALGVVTFAPACDEAATRQFQRGLALKHHMMYQQARATFRELTETAPDCAMGHWGVAATYFQPLWPERPDEETLATGRQYIEQARAAGPDDDSEAALINAVAAFFEQEETLGYRDRITAWAEGMDKAYAEHPDNPDIAALYGLSRLSLAMGADSDTLNDLHDEAEAILRAVWEAEPGHPGAIHYSIHATDVDGRAGNALEMVEAYADIAPSVPHALHMPSHIYVRLGHWDEVIEWNRRSADAARDHEVNGAISFHYIHGLDYLVYGHLQKGNEDQAKAVWEEAQEVERHQPGFASAFHIAAMPARIAVEQRDWETARALPVRKPDYLPWDNAHWPEGLSWYARGLGAIHTGDDELAEAAEARLAELRDAAEEAGESRYATNIEVDRKILAGWISHAGGDNEQAVALMKAAAELETTVEKDPITPGALYPPYEALGDLLLALERPEAAVAAYEAGDEIWPNRRNTRQGMQQAREQLAGL